MLFKTILIGIILLSTMVCFQNCSNLAQDYASSIQVTCSPATKPCLHYKLKVTNLKDSYKAMGILVQGDVNEGVPAATQFFGDCKSVNETYSLCSFDTVVKATITSNATTTTTKGDGRSLTLSIPTTSTVESYNRSSFAKIAADALNSNEICFATPSGVDVYSGESIDAFDPVNCD